MPDTGANPSTSSSPPVPQHVAVRPGYRRGPGDRRCPTLPAAIAPGQGRSSGPPPATRKGSPPSKPRTSLCASGRLAKCHAPDRLPARGARRRRSAGCRDGDRRLAVCPGRDAGERSPVLAEEKRCCTSTRFASASAAHSSMPSSVSASVRSAPSSRGSSGVKKSLTSSRSAGVQKPAPKRGSQRYPKCDVRAMKASWFALNQSKVARRWLGRAASAKAIVVGSRARSCGSSSSFRTRSPTAAIVGAAERQGRLGAELDVVGGQHARHQRLDEGHAEVLHAGPQGGFPQRRLDGGVVQAEALVTRLVAQADVPGGIAGQRAAKLPVLRVEREEPDEVGPEQRLVHRRRGFGPARRRRPRGIRRRMPRAAAGTGRASARSRRRARPPAPGSRAGARGRLSAPGRPAG